MPHLTPRRTALLVATTILAALGLVVLLLVLSGQGIPAGLLPAAAVAVVAAYIATLLLVKRFIQARVSLILRRINDIRMTAGGRAGTEPDADVLGELDSEVTAWAEQRSEEITELKAREQFRREFIGNLAHELKTPIFNIQGYILTLLEGGLEDAKVNRDFLNRASNGVDRLIKIVEDLDMITQLESGVMSMRMVRMDLAELVRGLISELEIQAREKQVKLVCAMPEPVWVMADRDRMAQVFLNLFTNAINYGRDGGRCEVRAFPLEDEQVLVEVSDDGIGISAEHLPRLFERFYRVGKSRARHEGGSGLGLAIVKHIVESHGQGISVRSEEGRGTTFSFTLAAAR
ncbi:MAG: sensor histidine kinase [Flavobacteriales bacterium]|nr:sensor histidine kinase [Flavobacteriales bacterium]